MLIDYIKAGVSFFFIDMSSDSEIENKTNPSLDELKNMKSGGTLKEWFTKKGMKKLATKIFL